MSQAEEVKGRLEASTVALTVHAGGGGRLFGAVTVADIASAIKAAGGPDIDKRRIEVGQPIKNVGEHTVDVRVHPDVSATVRLEVVAG